MSKIYQNGLLFKSVRNNNLLLNGNFNIWQRGPSFTSTGYTADRWYAAINGSASIVKKGSEGILDNNTYCLRIRTLATNSSVIISQTIETLNLEPLRGDVVTFSFYARIPTTTDLTNNWTDNIYACCNYSTSIDDIITNKTLIETSVINQSVSNPSSWIKYYVTFTIPNDARTLSVEIRPSNTSTLPLNSILDISQIKLEQGSSATSFHDLTNTEELAQCKRYFQTTEIDQDLSLSGSGRFATTLHLPSQLRTNNPTISVVSNKDKGITNKAISVGTTKSSLRIIGQSSSISTNIANIINIDNEIIPISLPGVPTNIQATRVADSGTINLTWVAPSSNGSDISSYYVFYKTNDKTNIDPYYNYVSSSMSFDGQNNSTAFIDSSPPVSGLVPGTEAFNNYWKTNSTGPIISTSQSKMGLSSLYLNGSTNLISTNYDIPAPSAAVSNKQRFAFPGDFTIEMWIRYSSIDVSNIMGIVDNSNGDASANIANPGWAIYKNVAGNLVFYQQWTGELLSISWSPIVDTWYHIAITRSGTTIRGFINGTVSGTTASYGTSFSSLGLQIGKVTRPTPFYHTGFIDDFRITKDICRYTSSFSPGSIPNPNDISISSINKLISSSTTAQISGLSDYSPYLIQVSATNALGDGSLSQEIAVGPIFSVPDAPTSLSVSWTGTYQLVSWIAPSNNGGSPIIRYELQRDIINTFSNPIAYAYTTDIASYIGNIYTSISKNTYYYRIRAINIAGNSSYSSTYSLSTSSPSAPPSAPVTTSLNSSVLLTWKPSISDNGDRIISYQIEHSASSSFTSSLMVSAGNTTSATITGLTNGSIRYFRVRAVNNMGLGAFSNYSSSTPLAPLSVPGAPTNFSSSWTTRTADTYPSISALSTWTDPISNGGSPIQSFIIETATNTEFTQNVSSPPIDTLSYLQTISHPITPTGNSVYYIRARAKNLVGTGPNSSTYALSGLIPSTMLAPIASPGNGLVSLSWSPPSKNGSIISSYIIDRSTTTNFASVTSNTVTNTSPGVNNVSITGLTNGSTYYFKIKAINITGTGIASAYSSALPSAPTAVPGIPLSFIMSRTSSTAASIKYTPPINNGGSAITGYSFQYSTNSGLSSPTTLSLSGTPIITNISGLSNVVYYNRISAMNSIGSSSYSSIQSTPIFLTNPGIPTNVTLANTTFWKPPYAIGYGERAISISWTAPVNFGGLSPVYYTPYLSTDNVNWADGCYFTGVSNMLRSPANTSPTCGAISATSGLFYGPRIKANTTYYLKVKAQNSIQSSGILFSSTSATKSITTGA